jgi:hypothetical protein
LAGRISQAIQTLARYLAAVLEGNSSGECRLDGRFVGGVDGTWNIAGRVRVLVMTLEGWLEVIRH